MPKCPLLEATLGEGKVQQILDEYASGKSMDHVARVVGGLSWQQVYKILKRKNVQLRTRTYYQIKRVSSIRVCIDPAIKGYVAGLLDGEGSIFKNKYRNGGQTYLGVSIANTDIKVLEFIQSCFGGKVVGLRPHPARFSKKPIYQWKIQSFIDVLTFLEQIEPYLIIKKAKADEAIAFCKTSLG